MLTLDDFKYETLQLTDDYEGKCVATLISANSNQNNRHAILYIHGFIDYFFHPHVAEYFLNNGFDFYALDLRKYGRSILPHQHACYCRYVEEYFEEIDIALYQIFKESKHHITILAHSFGGLVTSLYMNQGLKRNLVDKIILNSPFLAFNEENKVKEIIGKFFAPKIAKFKPFANIKHAVSPFYVKNLHHKYNGEWDFNLEWKPLDGFPAYYAWIHAVDKAQRFLKENSNIQIPVLVICSGSSIIPKKDSLVIKSTDIILNSHKIMHLSAYLGNDVMIKAVKHAVHDVFLSRASVREEVFLAISEWEKIILKKVYRISKQFFHTN